MNTHNPHGGEGEDYTADWPTRQRAGGHQPFPPQPHQTYPGYQQPGPGGPPPGWYPPGSSPQSITVAPKPEKKGRRRGLAIGGAFLAGIVVAGGAFAAYEFTSGRGDGTASGPRSTNAWPPPTSAAPTSGSGTPAPTSPSQPPAGNVDPAALRGFLLSAAELDVLLQTSAMVPSGVTSELGVGGRVTPPTSPDCLSTWAVLNKSTYWVAATGVAGQVVGEQPKPYHQVVQGVAAFADESAAQQFFDQRVRDWGECQAQPMGVDWGNGENQVERVRLGPSAVTNGMLTLAVEREVTEGPPLKCERAMTVRRNVVVDIRACRPNDPLAGAPVAQAIADKIAP